MELAKVIFLTVLVAGALATSPPRYSRPRPKPRPYPARPNTTTNTTTNATDSQPKSHWQSARKICYADDDTKRACFATVPNMGHSKSWVMKWLAPNLEEDGYDFNDTVTLDTQEIFVSRVEEEPTYMCQNKDAFIKAMECLQDSVKSKCPFLSESHTAYYDRLSKGMVYVCSRLPEMDSVCLHTHWSSMGVCKKHAYAEMKNESRSRRSNSTSSSSFNQTRSSNSSSPYSKRSWMSNSNSTRSNSSRPAFGGSKLRWGGRFSNRTGNSTGSMFGKGGSWKTSWNKNGSSSSNGSFGWFRSGRDEAYCKYKFIMMNCVRDTVSKCHGKTADIMYEYMITMDKPQCVDRIREWDLKQAAQKMVDCIEDQCDTTSIASHPFLSLSLALLSLFAGLVIFNM